MGVVVPKTPARPGLQIDVGEELRGLRTQGLKDVAALAELRTEVEQIKAWKRRMESHRTAVMATAATAVVAAIGTLVVLLFTHHA